MNDEALELRREIQNWQTRKFTIFAATTSFVTALSAYLATSADKIDVDWRIVACFFYLIIGAACLVTWLFARFNIKIGTYLWVIENSRWEQYQREFVSSTKDFSYGLNNILAMWYLVMGVAGAGVSYASIGFHSTTSVMESIYWLVFVCGSLLFLYFVWLLFFRSYPVDKFVEDWKRIKNKMETDT